MNHKCSNPDCVNGYIEDPDWCGDESHCTRWITCPSCLPSTYLAMMTAIKEQQKRDLEIIHNVDAKHRIKPSKS